MKLLGLVAEPVSGDAWARRTFRITPGGRPFELEREQPPIGSFVVVVVDRRELDAPTDDALADYLDEMYVRRTTYREATLADFVDAANAPAFVTAIPTAYNVDALERFANEHGLGLVNAIRSALDEDPTRAAAIAARARRFARIVGVRDADGILGELEVLHDVEHLLGLEHAIGRWVAGAAQPRAAELAELAKHLPSDAVSAGISAIWYRWWWQVARACSRSTLARVVERVIATADDVCGDRIAGDARAEAHRLATRIRSARRAELWAPIPSDVVPSTLVRDEADAHYCAFKAVSHAAHAVAHVLVDTAGVPYGDASRRAMRQLADAALRAAVA